MLAAAPVVALQLFLFLNPLLGRRARRFLAILLPSALVLFLVGVVFSYVAVLPLVLNFMLGFGADAAVPMIGFDKYMQEAKAVLLGMGLVFETPLLMFLFARFRILSCRQMAKVERWVPGVAFLIAGSISNTVEVSIPIAITVLFELGLFLAWITEGADWRRVDWRAVALRAAVVAAVGLAIAWWRFPAVGRFVLGLTRQ